MFMPADLIWLEPVLVMTAIVFVIGLIGNILSFNSRFMNALVTAIVFAVLAGVLFYMMYKDASPRTLAVPADIAWLEPVLVAAAIVFIVDLIDNMLSFSNRVLNALVTAVVFGLIFGGASFYLYKQGIDPAAGIPAPAAVAPAEPALAPAEPAPAAPAPATP